MITIDEYHQLVQDYEYKHQKNLYLIWDIPEHYKLLAQLSDFAVKDLVSSRIYFAERMGTLTEEQVIQEFIEQEFQKTKKEIQKYK